MKNYTKGPWGIHEYQNGTVLEWTTEEGKHQRYWEFAIGAGRTIIGSVDGRELALGGYDRPDSEEETKANAMLICAAPEMLEVLKQIAKLPVPPLNGDGPRLSISIMERVNSAINKVEGDSV